MRNLQVVWGQLKRDDERINWITTHTKKKTLKSCRGGVIFTCILVSPTTLSSYHAVHIYFPKREGRRTLLPPSLPHENDFDGRGAYLEKLSAFNGCWSHGSCLLLLKGLMATDILTASSAVPHDEGGVVNPRPASLEHTGNGGREE